MRRSLEALLHATEVVRRDERRVGAGHAHAEALVGAEVGAVTQDVADADHAPGPVAPRAQALFVEAAGDQADAEALVQVEAEDVAHDDRLVVDELQAVAGADVVAVGRPAQHLAAHGLAAQGGAHLLAQPSSSAAVQLSRIAPRASPSLARRRP